MYLLQLSYNYHGNQTLWIMHDNALLMQYHYQKWNIALFHYWFYNNALMQYCIIIFGKLHYLICIIFFTYFDKISWFQNIVINFKKHCFGSLIHIYLLFRYSDTVISVLEATTLIEANLELKPQIGRRDFNTSRI